MVAATSRSRAFFLELVLDIVIFALCAAVALQVFVHARLVSDRSVATTRLSLEAQQLAEGFKATGNQPEAELYFDAAFLPCDQSVARYRISCLSEDLRALEITAMAYDDSSETFEQLFSYSASYYHGNSAEVSK
jgi:Tfp pilus assembly protein PilE